MKKLIFLITLVFCYYLTNHYSPITNHFVVSADWPMVAGNPERSSWVNDSLVGTPHVEWYRPIDAYIPPNFQVIAANDLVYISSARGLYAFAYDTGDLVWRYDTEIPLGNSPTIATINGTSMAFVGGYDKKLHAFNALTGQHLWEFRTAFTIGFDDKSFDESAYAIRVGRALGVDHRVESFQVQRMHEILQVRC